MNIKKLGMKSVKKRNELIMRIGVLMLMFCVYCSNMVFVVAGTTNYGETIGKWVLEQLFWFAVVGILIGVIGCIIKRAYAAGGILLIVGSLVCVFIKNPNKISTIGSGLGSLFGF